MLKCDRSDNFSKNDQDEIAIVSWNLLAPLYDRSQLDWKATRLVALRDGLLRFVDCDVLCFQEIDLVNSLDDIAGILAEHGYSAITQQRKDFQVVNVTFFKASRLRVSWTQHRSRTLITSFVLPNEQEICVANVHLEAGGGKENQDQRQNQLASVLKRVRGNVVICGDFNSCLSSGSPLHADLIAADLQPAPAEGITWCQPGCCAACFDHIWASRCLVPTKFLGSSPSFLNKVSMCGIPDADNPSDHLPVANAFRLELTSSYRNDCEFLLVEPPRSPCEEIQQDWLQILRLANAGVCKRAMRDQKKLEKAFLGTISPEDARNLRSWQNDAATASKAIVAAAIKNAIETTQLRTPLPNLLTPYDPGTRHAKNAAARTIRKDCAVISAEQPSA